VLQARIPERLDDELRNRAGRLGLSVSTIVRNVLLNTFYIVEDIVHDSAELTHQVRLANAYGRTPRREPERILAWQRGTLNLNALCQDCNALLPKGSSAAIAMPLPDPPQFLCIECVERLESSSHGEKDSEQRQ